MHLPVGCRWDRVRRVGKNTLECEQNNLNIRYFAYICIKVSQKFCVINQLIIEDNTHETGAYHFENVIYQHRISYKQPLRAHRFIAQLFLFSDRSITESYFQNAIEVERNLDSTNMFRVRTGEYTLYIKLEPNTTSQNRSAIILFIMVV